LLLSSATKEAFPTALDLSIAQVLAKLEEKVAHHRDKKAFHVGQELLHHDQTAVHAAALETALAHLEAFKTASLSAGELLEKDEALAKTAAEVKPEIPLRSSQMAAKVLEGKAPDAVFGATAVTQEIEHPWGAAAKGRLNKTATAAAVV